jgi:hypothetical protein
MNGTILNGEVFFNMLEKGHPVSGSSEFLLKRWTKYSIYSKSGPYVRANFLKSGSYGWDGQTNTTNSWDNPAEGTKNIIYNRTITPTRGQYYNEPSLVNENTYQSTSVYLYDYVIVKDKWFYEYVYTASLTDINADSTPNLPGRVVLPTYPNGENYIPTNKWKHQVNSFKNSPDAITNNYIYSLDSAESIIAGHNVYGDPPIFRDDGVYFELVRGYPRNHFTHKRDLFSLFNMKSYAIIDHPISSGSYLRNRQTISTTVGDDGLENGSLPIQAIQVGNLNLVQTDNVINH